MNSYQKSALLAFTKLEEKTKRLFENDELVITYLSSHPDPDTDPDTIVENELEQIETYRDNFISAKVRFQEFSKIYEQKTQQLDISPSMDRLSINLPKLELIDFDGNPKNWFSFWSMFQKIDEDPKTEDDVKFAYLMQTTKGKAFDFVQSYHVSKGEYKTVIKNLKTRFADDKMLIELYVRELLKLILNQSHNMSFTDLVDQLDTYLRCLENLGVTKEKYACMLYPLVEASIPEQILIAWERERNSISRNSTANTHDLDLLIQFLRSEVTYLGWVAMGKSLSYTTCSNHAMPVISLLNGSKICDLWSLGYLGIRYPVENKTRKDIDDDTVSFFEKTVKFNQGRYEVNLPWVEGHPKLLDLQFQSEKCLNTMTSKLISQENLILMTKF
ncbi:uncharacterized protein TNCT_618311 [Trichonephila clavata]|uniref:Uncharacterized protein n=1 Tax=Trichonephila clavata TaxID=2740835 RepID=A0A8X6LVW1_TRICU|nr:uncharacterized protein TNCT_618311 [Trichonephila clavata]